MHVEYDGNMTAAFLLPRELAGDLLDNKPQDAKVAPTRTLSRHRSGV